MLNKMTKYLRGVAAMVMGAALLVLVLLAVGCGKSSTEKKDDIIVRLPQKPRPVLTHTPPADTVEVARTTETSEPVETPEHNVSPKIVTYEEAEAAFNGGQYGEAVMLFTDYTGRKPENPWGFYMLGLSARMTRDYVTAESAFNRALELDDSHVKSWLNLSRVLLDTDRADVALAKIDYAISLDHESADAYRLRGRALRQLGQKNEAIHAYQQAIVYDNTDAWSMNNMALVFIEEGRFEEAVPMLARAIELRDDVPFFLNNLGMALEGTGHFREAEEAYRQAVSIDSGYLNASTNLARIEPVVEQPGIEPVSLTDLALQFQRDIDGWSETLVATPDIDNGVSEAPDSTVVVNDAASGEESR